MLSRIQYSTHSNSKTVIWYSKYSKTLTWNYNPYPKHKRVSRSRAAGEAFQEQHVLVCGGAALHLTTYDLRSGSQRFVCQKKDEYAILDGNAMGIGYIWAIVRYFWHYKYDELQSNKVK